MYLLTYLLFNVPCISCCLRCVESKFRRLLEGGFRLGDLLITNRQRRQDCQASGLQGLEFDRFCWRGPCNWGLKVRLFENLVLENHNPTLNHHHVLLRRVKTRVYLNIPMLNTGSLNAKQKWSSLCERTG